MATDGNHMDELVQQISSNAGVNPATGRAAVAIILKFLLIEAEGDKAQELVASIPGAAEAIADAPEIAGGGVMGIFSSLRSAGLGIGEIQVVASELLSYANEKVGEEEMRLVLSSVPGLNQFI